MTPATKTARQTCRARLTAKEGGPHTAAKDQTHESQGHAIVRSLKVLAGLGRETEGEEQQERHGQHALPVRAAGARLVTHPRDRVPLSAGLGLVEASLAARTTSPANAASRSEDGQVRVSPVARHQGPGYRHDGERPRGGPDQPAPPAHDRASPLLRHDNALSIAPSGLHGRAVGRAHPDRQPRGRRAPRGDRMWHTIRVISGVTRHEDFPCPAAGFHRPAVHRVVRRRGHVDAPADPRPRREAARAGVRGRPEVVRRSDRPADGGHRVARRLHGVVRLARRPHRHQPPLRDWRDCSSTRRRSATC